MKRTRVAITIEVDCDPVPGSFHEPKDWRKFFENEGKNRFPHYNPSVTDMTIVEDYDDEDDTVTAFTLPSHWPVAFTSEAEIICPQCAETRHGVWKNGLGPEGVTDFEGNEVRPVYSWEEMEPNTYCGSCRSNIK